MMEDTTMENEKKFYQQPLLMWILILVMPPIGLFLMWYFSHYTFVARVAISIYFFTLFRVNTFMSLSILIIIVFGFLHMNLTLNKYDENDDLQDEDELIIPNGIIENMTVEEFKGLINALLPKMGYQITQNNDAHLKGIDLFAKKGKKVYGVKLKSEIDIIKQDILQMCDGLDYYECNKGVIITNQSYTPCAKEAADSTNIILWDVTVLKQQIRTFKIFPKQWQIKNNVSTLETI